MRVMKQRIGGMIGAERCANGGDRNAGRLTTRMHVGNDFVPDVLVEHPLPPTAMKGMRLLVEKRLVIVRADAEHLYPSRIDEITNRRAQAVPLKFPLIAVAGWEREKRRAPMTEDRHPHVVTESWRKPVLMKCLHSWRPATISPTRPRSRRTLYRRLFEARWPS